ncbi:MAG: hypothetical protein RMJ56_13700 [Gemmataceae bacterium]|nr:hypothetical protein [Gemmata sp.]MDW8198646.1 hypothetical protein [Gemmataceae bacterium]
MRVRLLGCFLLATLGCESLRTVAPAVNERSTPPLAPTGPTPVSFSPPPQATPVGPSEPSPHSPVPREPDFLALFMECLERDDLHGAARHLEAYVQRHPDQPLFRFQLAALYTRCHGLREAQFHYECFTRDAETHGTALAAELITAHIQLLEMAQQRGDQFAELYHRGVGLWLLVRQQETDPHRDAAFCEEILCKAYRALTEAKELKPSDPRTRTYLAAIQEYMGNRHAAEAERAAVRRTLVCGEHTGRAKSLE